MSRNRVLPWSAWGAIATLLGCNAADEGPSDAPQGAAEPLSTDAMVTQLEATYPKARVFTRGARVRRVYGVMTQDDSAQQAAERFLRTSATAFGLAPDDLVMERLGDAAADPNGEGLLRDPVTGAYEFRLFRYRQERDGVPVFGAVLRTLVRDEGDHPVVWANADLRPLGDFRAQRAPDPGVIDLRRSLHAIRTQTVLANHPHLAPTALVVATPPSQTIFAGVGVESTPPRMALLYTARDASRPGSWTFVADAETGDILHVESHLHFDILGTVEAESIVGPESMECGDVGATPLPYARVTSPLGEALTDASGAFTLVESGSGLVPVTSELGGTYFSVENHAGDDHAMTLEVAPPGPADFLHRDLADPPELVLAQINAYREANALREMLLAYAPDYPVIASETDFQINVNRIEMTCEVSGGAWYDDDNEPRTINFCRGTADRANTAFRSIIHHEYGHHIVGTGGSGQSEYGEGMADTIAMLFAGDPRIGVGYYPNECDEPLRHADRDCQYIEQGCSSCGSGLYECGAVLSSTIWDIWQRLEATDPATADDTIRALVFNSIPLHSGTSIDPSLAIDMLVLDDDDGLLENGTPHYVEICGGFAAHGMDCPAIVDGLVVQGVDLDAEGPSDGPFAPESVTYTLHNLGPDDELAYAVRLPAGTSWLTIDEPTGTILLGGQTTVTIAIDQLEATSLFDGDYTAAIELVNETSGVGTVTREARLRVGALVPIHTVTFDAGLDGFTADAEPGNLWHHTVACVDPLPGHSSPGSLYYGRDDRCDFTTPVPIRHTITSPAFEIGNPDTVELEFTYLLQTEADPNYDDAEVLLSVDGGPFEVVASNNSGGALLRETPGWETVQLEISDRLPAAGPTDVRIQLAFNANDPDNNTRSGFAVDDLTIHARPGASPSCTLDLDCDDGELCTDDRCDAGVCAHADNGACASQGPCAAYCADPVTYGTTHFDSGWLGTAVTCHETTVPLRGGICGNFVHPRRLFVNGVEMPCTWTPWTSLPPAVQGGYCIHTDGGGHPWAGFSTWAW